MKARRYGQKPLCKCGCGQLVKQWQATWATPQCVPREVRVAGAKRSRQLFAYRRRAIYFEAEWKRLVGRGQVLTKEAIVEAFQAVYRKGYSNGFQAARHSNPEFIDSRVARRAAAQQKAA